MMTATPTITALPMPGAMNARRASGAPVAELRGVTKRYANGVEALRGLDLTLGSGEVVALLGANGAGKSTAVKLMLGISTATAGSVRVFGVDPRDKAARLRTGAMLQVGKAPETLRVREHLALFRGYYATPLAASELVRLAGLAGMEDRLFGELSGGQKQRVLFALALAGDPDLVFLDEPTVGLDIEARRVALPTRAAVAPAALAVFARETRFEFVRLLRTRAFSLSVIGFPVMFYVLFGLVMNRGAHIGGVSVARYLLAGYCVFGAVGAALFGVGNALATELHAGWLELKRASPMPAAAYLVAKMLSAIAFGLIVVAVLITIAHWFAAVTLTAGDIVRVLALTVIASVPFSLLGCLVALLAPPNSAPGVTNLLYLTLSFLGGLWIPITQLPVALQHFAVALPTYQLGQLMLTVLGSHGRGSVLDHIGYLAGFTLVCAGLVRLLFHRRELNA